jgi:hypothetical protein
MRSSSDKSILDAATTVISAARKFGTTQAKMSKEWIDRALAGANTQEQLMEMQLALFEECSIDHHESGACAELEAALDELTELAVARQAAGLDSPTSAKNPFTAKSDPMQKAQARVLEAAAKFGPEQQKYAEEWLQQTAGEMKVNGSGSLLGASVDLFGDCVLSEDGSPSKCEEMAFALSEFQTLVAPVEQVDVLSTKLSGKVIRLDRGLFVEQTEGAAESQE